MSGKGSATIKKTQIVATFTGMPVGAETLVRNSLNHISGVATGMILIWLSQHGFSEHAANAIGFSISEIVGALVASIIGGGASILWGWWQAHRTKLQLVNNTVAAALTGVVPIAIAKEATETQAAAIDASPTATIAPIPPAPPVKL